MNSAQKQIASEMWDALWNTGNAAVLWVESEKQAGRLENNYSHSPEALRLVAMVEKMLAIQQKLLEQFPYTGGSIT